MKLGNIILNSAFIMALGFLDACTTDNINNGAAKSDDLYLAQVRTIMYDTWQQPSSLAGKQYLVTRVLISVQQDGKIVQKEIVGASGNNVMEISVMTAVDSVKNLPKPPSGFGGFYK